TEQCQSHPPTRDIEPAIACVRQLSEKNGSPGCQPVGVPAGPGMDSPNEYGASAEVGKLSADFWSVDFPCQTMSQIENRIFSGARLGRIASRDDPPVALLQRGAIPTVQVGERAAGDGMRHVGQRSAVSGQRSVVSGQWSVDSAVRGGFSS